MSTRKISLLAVFTFLLLVCIFQAVKGSINPVKIIKTDADPDAFTITKDGTNIEVLKRNNIWYVGNDDYLANKSDVEKMTKEIKEIKILDKIGRLGNAENDEKYNLSEGKYVLVKAFKGGKEIQTMLLGKTSSTGAQTYAAVAGNKDICLLSGNVLSVFSKSEEELRGKTVYAVEENEITGACVKTGNSELTVTKTSKKNEEDTYSLSGSDSFELDNSETKKWIQNVAFLNINSWIDDSTILPANKLTSFELYTKNETIKVDIYEEKNGDTTKYTGTCSRTKHKFELTKGQTEKFAKNLKDLKIKE